MPVENTDLERRVLAHEQILQALMAQLAEGKPGFLDRMRERFASSRRGAHEHDYVETADYAEAFLHEVMRLGRTAAAKAAAPTVRPITAGPPGEGEEEKTSEPARGAKAIVIRTVSAGGVWHVTRDNVFFGDYLTEEPARAAATKAAHEVEADGGRTELIFEDRR